jgi:hypothetical protein
MTLAEFQKKVIRDNWYDKYWFFLLYAAMIGVGVFFLYDVIAHQSKYDKYGTQFLAYFLFILFVFMGVRGLYLVPNRYKILTTSSLLSVEAKKQIIVRLIKELGDPFYNTVNTFYSFSYQNKWWSSSYKIFLSLDSENFYVSVQSKTGGYYSAGIIDFGSTEKVRQKIINCLTDLIARQNEEAGHTLIPQ